MKKKTKIYIITECPYVGVFQAIFQMSLELKKMDFEITFLLPAEKRNRYGETQNDHEDILLSIGNIIHVPLRRKYRYILSDVLYLKKLFKKNPPDLLISYTIYAGKVCRILYKIGFLKNYYHAPQCVGVRRERYPLRISEFLFEKFLAQQVDFYLSCGPSESFILNKKYNVPLSKIILLPNFKKIILKDSEEKIYEFLYLGRMVKDKGIFELLESFKITNKLNQLVVIGDGTEIKKLKIKYPEVRFMGRLKNTEVLDYLQKTKFFLSNSIIEGMPFTLIEAMSLGVIPIVSDVEGHKDLIVNGYNGFLYENQLDLVNFIFKIHFLSEEERNKISANAIYSINKLNKLAIESLHNHFKKYE